MLVYKAWLETRARFLSGAAILALLTLHTVWGATETIRAYNLTHPARAVSYGEYVWLQLHSGYGQAVWIFCALLLGHGGLPRERRMGTSGFTLSLPLERSRLLLTRTAVCVLELAALALVPALILSGVSPVVGESYPLQQSLLFVTTTVGGGLVFLGIGSLLPHFFEGEFTGPMVGICVVTAWFSLAQIPSLQWLNVFHLMSGAGYLDEGTLFFEGRFPWAGLAASLGCAALLLTGTRWLAGAEDY
jgi:ABC-type transport system involved in multi-copper enzyme maturation permease subunit